MSPTKPKPSKWKAPESDPEAFARAATRRKNGSTCGSCADPRVRSALETFVRLWKAGESQLTIRGAAEFLKANYGYGQCLSQLRYCLDNHHGRRANE